MERTVTRSTLREAGGDLHFWLAQPVQARIDAVETLRQAHMQTQPDADARLQRVCRVTQRPRR